jgi:hypothetical protein
MRIADANLLVPALLFGCSTAPAPNPFAGGVLTHTAYVQVVGMPTELAEVAQEGMARGWRTICTGKAGEESTLRLQLPAGTRQSDVDGYFGDLNHMRGSANHLIYHGMPRTKGCDEEPQRSWSEPMPADYQGPRVDPAVIMTGPEGDLRALLPIARLCGIRDPVVRPFRDTDISPRPDFVTADFHSLASSESLSEHPGPALCFLHRSTQTLRAAPPHTPER